MEKFFRNFFTVFFSLLAETTLIDFECHPFRQCGFLAGFTFYRVLFWHLLLKCYVPIRNNNKMQYTGTSARVETCSRNQKNQKRIPNARLLWCKV